MDPRKEAVDRSSERLLCNGKLPDLYDAINAARAARGETTPYDPERIAAMSESAKEWLERWDARHPKGE